MSVAVYKVTSSAHIPYPLGSTLLWSPTNEIGIQATIADDLSGENTHVALGHSKRVTTRTINACCIHLRDIQDADLRKKVESISQSILAIEKLENEAQSSLSTVQLK